MNFLIGDRVKALPGCMWVDAGEIGTIIDIEDFNIPGVEFDNYVHGHSCDGGKAGHCFWISAIHLESLEHLEIKKENMSHNSLKRTFTNSQKIRLRLKTFWSKNSTGYDDFEEYYSAFTDAVLDNLEFLAETFKI